MKLRACLFTGLLGASFFGSVVMLHYLHEIRSTATLQEFLYVPSPKIVSKMSLGYGTLISDIYWTRAVQYFGSHRKRGAMEYKLLQPLLDIATTLDPKLIPAYDFGSVFLAERPPAGAGDPIEAVNLLQRGIQNNPKQWKLYEDIGFIYYMELKDYPRAGQAFEEGSKIPGAHPFLKIMAARTLAMGGNYQTSEMLWLSLYESTSDKTIHDSAVEHLRALKVDQDVEALEASVQKYHDQTRHWPSNFTEMVAAGYLQAAPRDPLGMPYVLGPQGSVHVEDYKKLPFITKGLPPGVEPSNIDYTALKP
jgi:tetratricopeptide (TPR) repeat protein